jgi:hypothetical protein
VRLLLGRHTDLTVRSRTFLVGATALALALVLSSGGAYAYFTSHGSGTGHATAGTPLSVTVTATSGTADLLPGAAAGKVYFTLTNPDSPGASFNKVTAVSPTSTSSVSCPVSNISFPSLPYTFSPPATVGANTTSGTEFIAGFVMLAANAPNACQGVTFTVSLTLAGQLS